MLGENAAMSFCPVCGRRFFEGETVVEIRQHIFNEHYEHVLMQMDGDKQKLKEWMELKT